MSVLKLHLEDEELAPIVRLAEQLRVRPEDVVFAGLNQMMLRIEEPTTRIDIMSTSQWRIQNLPRWADSARSVHAYEGKADGQSSAYL